MTTYQSLLSQVRQVRRKWRLQALVRGASLLLACTVAMLILGVWGADLFGFKPAAVWFMRVITGAALLYVAYRFFVAPLLQRVSDVQIAQYIEERYPQLQDRLVTAVELGEQSKISGGMLDMLVRDALENTRRVDFSVFVDRRRITIYGIAGGGALLVLLALLSWGPSFFPYGFDRVYMPWAEASSHSRSMIMVTPGNADMAKGADQQIKAQLIGFDSPDVRLFTKSGGANWASYAMEPEPRGSGFLYLLIDIRNSIDYYIEANGIRTPEYHLNVVDLPRIESFSLTYDFPAYTGMSPQTVEKEGDISALKGTRVTLTLKMNQPATSARLLFDNQGKLDMKPGVEGREFTGAFTLSRSGSYLVQLEGGGRRYPGSPEYEIEAIDDAPPTVSITKPMRDMRATNVEEVFSELKAEDDIGMGKLELRYSVNGAEEKSLTLYNGKPSQQAVTGAHTFFLEEFGLQPGDIVSYYGKATDNNNVTGPGTASTDIYFIQIRPFDQKYTQSQQGGMGGGGESGQEALSRQQKDIISATFKLIRDKDKMEAKEYLDSLKSLALVQNRLQAQTQGVVERLQRRGAADAGENFAKLGEYLSAATKDMEKAGIALGAQKPSDALPSEQKALQQLMRAESLFRDIQVSFSQSGGSGGGSQANAEDLADLFELELNKLKNQYETVQRGEQQQRDQKVDEAMQRLKELAQRQQQLNERNRMMSGAAGNSGSTSSSGGGQSQQQLLDETEKLQRQLQRLSRERSSPELNQASSQLQKAIEEMKKSLDRTGRADGHEGSAQGIRALQQLDDARRTLGRGLDQGLNQGIERALEESRKLLDEQKRVQEGIDGLSRDEQAAANSEGQQKRDDIIERKNVMAGRLKGLGSQLDELSRQARKGQKETSARLGDAAGIIRDKRLPERIQANNQLIQGGYYDPVRGREDFIRSGLEDLARQLEAAKGSLGQTPEGKLEEAVNRARQLAEGLESMQQRMGGRQGRQGQGQQSDRARAGRNGEPGQQGEEGRNGKSGKSGQPGEEGRNGAQGQRGEAQQSQAGQGSQQGESRSPGGTGFNPAGGTSPGGQSMTGDAFGPPTGIGRYTDEDIRQLQREAQQRMADAQDLRRLLDRNPTQMKNLEQIIGNLRNMEGSRNYNDPEQVSRLKAAIDLMRQVELDLSRDLSRLTQKEKYFYSDDSEAPSSYKKLVEEYYRALARGKQ
jgi:hypothetical protein